MQPDGEDQAPPTTLNALPRTAREIVVILKRSGEMSAEEISENLHLTVSTIRQALSPLRSSKIVHYRETGSGRGRRRHVYSLTTTGHGLFPGLSEYWSRDLVRFLKDRAPELVTDFMRERMSAGRGQIEKQSEGSATLKERVARVVEYYESVRFMASMEEGEQGETDFVVQHCPLMTLAAEFPTICETERRILEQTFGEEVERTEWVLEGSRVCRHRCTGRPAPVA